MKKLIVGVVLAMAPVMAFAHQYDISTVINADGGGRNDVSVGYNNIALAYDSLGNVGMCYYDANSDLKYGHFNGNVWSIETADDGGPNNQQVGQDCAIIFDDDDNPHIVYYNMSNGHLKHATHNGNAWTQLTVDATASQDMNGISRISIAKDNVGDIGVAYHVRVGDNLKYAKFSGGRWTVSTVQQEGSTGWYPSLAFTSRGNPAIAYQDNNGGKRALKYITYDGNRWQVPETVDEEKVAGLFNSLKLDSNDKPHIAYSQSDPAIQFYVVYYINKVGRTWSERYQLAGAQGQATGMYTQMAIDSQNNVFIIYVDQFLSALFPDVNYLKLTSLYFVDRGMDYINSRTDRLAFSINLDDYVGLAIAVDDSHHLMAAWAQETGRNYDLVTARITQWSPSITLLTPNADSNSGRDNFEVRWLDFDPDSNATIRFSRRDADWNTVALNETAREDGENSVVIDLSGIPAGDYGILAEISDDDFNMWSSSFGRANLTVQARPAPADQGQQNAQAPADQGQQQAQAGGAQQANPPNARAPADAQLPGAGNAPAARDNNGQSAQAGGHGGAASGSGSSSNSGSSGGSSGSSSSSGNAAGASAASPVKAGGCALIRP